MKANEVYGQLTAIQLVDLIGIPSRRKWLFACDCGKQTKVRAGDVERGATTCCRGCGAAKAGQTKSANSQFRSQHPLYKTWDNMINRCQNPNAHNYIYYGGRGIKVCARWKKFKNFLADVGERPFPGATIDRKDNNGDYEPSNIRWATHAEQQNNRSNSLCTVHERS